MKSGSLTASVLLGVCVVLTQAKAQITPGNGDVPRLPGAELLVRDYLQGRWVLLLTAEEKTLTLREDAISLNGNPSISADGSVVAFAHRIPGDLSRDPRLIASTYSVKDGKWTDHPELEDVWGSVAISPDGSKLACVTYDRWARNRGTSALPPPRLQVLDLRTGKVTVATKPSESPGPGALSWSPDGRRIAFEMQVPAGPVSDLYAIDILNVETGTISQIALGQSPSWSPSGEWIAYAGYVQIERNEAQPGNSQFYDGRYYSVGNHQFSLMGPNGTHRRVLMGFRSDVEDNAEPVWSPDSKELLLTRVRDPDQGTSDIYMFDSTTHRLTKKFRNTTARVYAWTDAQ